MPPAGSSSRSPRGVTRTSAARAPSTPAWHSSASTRSPPHRRCRLATPAGSHLWQVSPAPGQSPPSPVDVWVSDTDNSTPRAAHPRLHRRAAEQHREHHGRSRNNSRDRRAGGSDLGTAVRRARPPGERTLAERVEVHWPRQPTQATRSTTPSPSAQARPPRTSTAHDVTLTDTLPGGVPRPRLVRVRLRRSPSSVDPVTQTATWTPRPGATATFTLSPSSTTTPRRSARP